jgi:hypothetical protein
VHRSINHQSQSSPTHNSDDRNDVTTVYYRGDMTSSYDNDFRYGVARAPRLQDESLAATTTGRRLHCCYGGSGWTPYSGDLFDAVVVGSSSLPLHAASSDVVDRRRCRCSVISSGCYSRRQSQQHASDAAACTPADGVTSPGSRAAPTATADHVTS